MNIEDIKPLGQRCLVEVIEGDKVSQTGLAVSNNNSLSLPVRGRVLAIGDGGVYINQITQEKLTFSIGDVLLFRRYAIDELKFNIGGDEMKVYLADYTDILAKVELPAKQEN